MCAEVMYYFVCVVFWRISLYILFCFKCCEANKLVPYLSCGCWHRPIYRDGPVCRQVLWGNTQGPTIQECPAHATGQGELARLCLPFPCLHLFRLSIFFFSTSTCQTIDMLHLIHFRKGQEKICRLFQVFVILLGSCTWAEYRVCYGKQV